jgi:hypothetical protein
MQPVPPEAERVIPDALVWKNITFHHGRRLGGDGESTHGKRTRHCPGENGANGAEPCEPLIHTNWSPLLANPLYEEGCPQGGVCRDANNRSTKLIVKTENRASKI